MPTYVSNTPVANNPPRVDQPTITNNFIYLNADQSLSQVGLNVDHFFSGNSATSKDGFHRWCRFIRVPVSGTPPTTVAQTFALYNDTAPNVPASGSALWIVRDNSGATKHQFTGPTPVLGNLGYTYLPGGLIMQWGLQAVATNTTTAVNFNVNYLTACYNVQVTGIRNNNGGDGAFVSTGSVTTSGFTVRNGSGSINQVYWVAIGA